MKEMVRLKIQLFEQYQKRAIALLNEAGIVLTSEEMDHIEVADFGLDDFERQGLLLVTYVNNERYCAKSLVLFPQQTCPEHRHPPVGSDPGKMETFRCCAGTVYLYVEGAPAVKQRAIVPAGAERYYTVFHEIVLQPGEQFTIAPNTLHWFQAGSDGAVIAEFSSTSRDELDVFTDPRIRRLPHIEA